MEGVRGGEGVARGTLTCCGDVVSRGLLCVASRNSGEPVTFPYFIIRNTIVNKLLEFSTEILAPASVVLYNIFEIFVIIRIYRHMKYFLILIQQQSNNRPTVYFTLDLTTRHNIDLTA